MIYFSGYFTGTRSSEAVLIVTWLLQLSTLFYFVLILKIMKTKCLNNVIRIVHTYK